MPEDETSAATQVANQLRRFLKVITHGNLALKIHLIVGLSIGGQASTSQEGNSSAMDTTNHSSNSNENASGNSSNRRLDDVEFDFD